MNSPCAVGIPATSQRLGQGTAVSDAGDESICSTLELDSLRFDDYFLLCLLAGRVYLRRGMGQARCQPQPSR
jgi:hypothetical protein